MSDVKVVRDILMCNASEKSFLQVTSGTYIIPVSSTSLESKARELKCGFPVAGLLLSKMKFASIIVP